LRTVGYEQNIIDTVLADLERTGLVDDAEFARMWVAERTAVGTGRHRLQWELRQKGLREDLICQAVAETVDDGRELEQAFALAQRRLRGQLAEGPALLRLRRFLLGRGYGFEVVEQVMRRLASQENLSDAP
jgi:regulatory protein